MDLDTFLAHAVKLEHEAVETYERFSALVNDIPEDTAAFLKEMAHYARLHLGEIMNHAGHENLSALPKNGYIWGDQVAPEVVTSVFDADGSIDLANVMQMAHAAECRAATFYENVAQSTRDPRVTLLAREFAAEEQQHMLALERFMGIKPY